MRRSYLWVAWFPFALLTTACSDDEGSGGGSPPAPTTSTGTSTTASGGAAGQGGSGASGGAGAAGGQGGSGASAGGTLPFELPDLHGRVFFGHYLGQYDLYGFATATLTASAGSPVQPGAPAGEVLGVSSHDFVAVTMEGGTTLAAYAAGDLSPLSGSPYATGYGPTTMAHDDARDRLYVHCIGTVGQPTESLLTVYDTSTLPWTELPGSPFDVDVPAFAMVVDPVTGTLFGVSLTTLWAARLEGSAVVHLSGSPQPLEATGSDIAIDPARRRLYVAERSYGGAQRLHAYDVDTFAPVAESPLTIPGTSMGDIAANPVTGDVFVVDFGSLLLHSVSADPFALRNTCGSNGCALPPTETGLALDYETDRLFVAHVPDVNNPDDGPGLFTAWDVSDPTSPSEITTAGSRPALATYPNRASVQ